MEQTGKQNLKNISYQKTIVLDLMESCYWVFINSSKFGRLGILDLCTTYTSWVSKAVPCIILLYAGQYNYTAQKKKNTYSTNRCPQNPAYVSPKENRSDHKNNTWIWSHQIINSFFFFLQKNIYAVFS